MSIFYLRKLRHREAKQPAHRCQVRTLQGWDLTQAASKAVLVNELHGLCGERQVARCILIQNSDGIHQKHYGQHDKHLLEGGK